MRNELKNLLRQPGSPDTLELVAFDASSRPDGLPDVREGILVHSASRRAYPILDGVPVMLEESFTADFLTRHAAAIAEHAILVDVPLRLQPREEWSFSDEWAAHFATNSERTWGYTVQERLEQLFMETDTAPEWFRGKLVLDAGCGNGALSSALSALGATVVGLDYSSSVSGAERHRRSDSVHFARGDLQTPPLAPGLFDLVFSIGVLHHTPDTMKTFQAVARLVKPGGKFYVWLYRRPERFVGRLLKVPVYDLGRMIISRCPPRLQGLTVNAYARLVRATHTLRDRRNPIPLREYVISAYDDLTPRWRHYHTPIEVSRWYHEAGFRAPMLSHWDNPYGFGLVATRNAQAATPGVHYGTGAKLWDNSKTLLGQLHTD